MFTSSFRPPPTAGTTRKVWKPIARAVYLHSRALPINSAKTVEVAESQPNKIIGYEIPYIMTFPQHQQFATIESAIGTTDKQQQGTALPQAPAPQLRASNSARAAPRQVPIVVDPYQGLTEGMKSSRTSFFSSAPVTPAFAASIPSLSATHSSQMLSTFSYKVALSPPRVISAGFNPPPSQA
ncbi:hypothetical protein FOL47_001724 [Perkinsus chesapeaki]|uniref:Uncharacterized protein n=1 Tax=Perkinsus chesapeaki TaxID=330153 RepID=A0A7J6MHI7_PERCH|nr:hypothetical protein FOL47_001724 [Perkinsus chesapeaki]